MISHAQTACEMRKQLFQDEERERVKALPRFRRLEYMKTMS